MGSVISGDYKVVILSIGAVTPTTNVGDILEGPQMQAIRDMVVPKGPELEQEVQTMGTYLGQHATDFHIRGNCPWMDKRLIIRISLRTLVDERILKFQKGKVTSSIQRNTDYLQPPTDVDSVPLQLKSLICAKRIIDKM